jgi:hypothetical protein
MLLVALLLLLLLSPSSLAQLIVGKPYGFETPAASAGLYSSSFKNPDSKTNAFTPFTFTSWAGISDGGDFSNTDGTVAQGTQFGFLQAGYLDSGPPNSAAVSIPSSIIQTTVKGLVKGSTYNVSFAYSNRNPIYANENCCEPAGADSGNVKNLTLLVTVGRQPIFSKTLNSDSKTFIYAFGTFKYTGLSTLLSFSGAAPYGDQTILLDDVNIAPV